MKRNMGQVDRAIRALIGLGIIYAYVYDYLPEKASVVLLVLSVVMIVTSVFSVCPLYSLFGISTYPDKKTRG